MARRSAEVDELVKRVLALDVEQRANLLAKLIAAGGRNADWSVITRIQKRVSGHRTRKVARLVERTVRDVRRERQRPA